MLVSRWYGWESLRGHHKVKTDVSVVNTWQGVTSAAILLVIIAAHMTNSDMAFRTRAAKAGTRQESARRNSGVGECRNCLVAKLARTVTVCDCLQNY